MSESTSKCLDPHHRRIVSDGLRRYFHTPEINQTEQQNQLFQAWLETATLDAERQTVHTNEILIEPGHTQDRSAYQLFVTLQNAEVVFMVPLNSILKDVNEKVMQALKTNQIIDDKYFILDRRVIQQGGVIGIGGHFTGKRTVVVRSMTNLEVATFNGQPCIQGTGKPFTEFGADVLFNRLLTDSALSNQSNNLELNDVKEFHTIMLARVVREISSWLYEANQHVLNAQSNSSPKITAIDPFYSNITDRISKKVYIDKSDLELRPGLAYYLTNGNIAVYMNGKEIALVEKNTLLCERMLAIPSGTQVDIPYQLIAKGQIEVQEICLDKLNLSQKIAALNYAAKTAAIRTERMYRHAVSGILQLPAEQIIKIYQQATPEPSSIFNRLIAAVLKRAA